MSAGGQLVADADARAEDGEPSEPSTRTPSSSSSSSSSSSPANTVSGRWDERGGSIKHPVAGFAGLVGTSVSNRSRRSRTELTRGNGGGSRPGVARDSGSGSAVAASLLFSPSLAAVGIRTSGGGARGDGFAAGPRASRTFASQAVAEYEGVEGWSNAGGKVFARRRGWSLARANASLRGGDVSLAMSEAVGVTGSAFAARIFAMAISPVPPVRPRSSSRSSSSESKRNVPWPTLASRMLELPRKDFVRAVFRRLCTTAKEGTGGGAARWVRRGRTVMEGLDKSRDRTRGGFRKTANARPHLATPPWRGSTRWGCHPGARPGRP